MPRNEAFACLISTDTFYFSNIFNLQLVESVNLESLDTKSRMMFISLLRFFLYQNII